MVDQIITCLNPEYESMRELMNDNFSDETALQMILTAFSGEPGESINVSNIVESLKKFGFSSYPVEKNAEGKYMFSNIYDRVCSGELLKDDSDVCMGIAVSYTQIPEQKGKHSMPEDAKQKCSIMLALIRNHFKTPNIAVWFDKLAIKQAEKAQTYWAITSNLMFLAFPVLSIAPRHDQYAIERTTHAYMLEFAGMHNVLYNHTERIAICDECWKHTHAACSAKEKTTNRHTMINGGLWIDGWLRCWPEVERRLGALNKGTYVAADDFLLLLDTYMLVSNVSKELFANVEIDNKNADRDTKWLTELAWMQNTKQKKNTPLDNNRWCNTCNTKLIRDVTISIEDKTDTERGENWTSTIQLLQGIKRVNKVPNSVAKSSYVLQR